MKIGTYISSFSPLIDGNSNINIKIFHNLSQEEWLALKKEDITSTEVAALYGYSPYDTEYSLYFKKRGEFKEEPFNSKRAFFGLAFQDTIAQIIGNLYGVQIEKMPTYIRHESINRMGSSFDYRIIGLREDWNPEIADIEKYSILRNKFRDFGSGILEIKTVDKFIFKQKWEDGEPPVHMEFQVQHQMEVANISWSAIGVLIGGNEIELILRDRDKLIGEKICKKITKFWKMVDDNIEPKLNFSKDYDIIKDIYPATSNDQILDLNSDLELEEDCKRFNEIKEQLKNLGEEEGKIKAKILKKIEANAGAESRGFIIKMSDVKEVAATVITEEMVGKSYGGRKAYRAIKIKEKNNE